MRKLTVPFVLALSVLSGAANADALGFFVGGGVWDYDSSGTFGSTGVGDSVIDVESNLGFNGEQDAYLWAAFEHFVPIIPNIRVEAATVGDAGSANGLVFEGIPVNGDASVSLDTVDFILYYRLLDNWVNLDLGLTVRQLDGDFKLDTQVVSISETIPMLYFAAQFDLPLTGLSLGGDINIIDFDGSKYQDIRLRAMYEIGVIGFEAGLRTTSIELNDVSGINSDLEFSGLIVGAFLHF
ncbi:MAG TPA: TIGR04219 family outer membrane beta-barrel protein [Gammaproteobacteria bacterium]|nr:TIGR04219 family outer membrane beta-barrel protein [Gammaproteobacteria bacterium]